MVENVLDTEQGRKLAQELERLRSVLKESGNACAEAQAGDVLAILRFCPGLPLDDWRALSSSHNLSEWLAMPLEGDLFPRLVELQKQLAELAHLSDHDALTGLSNRRAFERALDLEIERSRRGHTPISLVILDLDDFKKVNDTYGHPCGDKVLVALAEILLHEKRRYDMAARTGGEEFSLILSGVGLLRAQAMVQRVIEAVREMEVACGDATVRMTISAGIASYRGRVEMSPAELVELADKALYDAKHSGKDQYVSAPIPDMAAPMPEATLVHSNEKKFLFTGIK